jgi:LPS O-antigen subunit length determinant protein (WzzB/FepE family)
MNNTNSHQEDEIDLKDLFHTILEKKKFIIIFTFLVTISAIIWVVTRIPIYEAQAIIRIGYYKINNKSKISLDNSSSLSQELNILYIELFKNSKEEISKITNINIVKKQKDFLIIKSTATSNKLASMEIEKVTNYIKHEHKKIIDLIKNNRELIITRLENKINKINNKELPILKKKIIVLEKEIKNRTIDMISFNKSKNKDKNPIVILELYSSKETLSKLQDKIFTLENSRLSELEEKINDVKRLLKPHNFKNTYIVGNIITNDSPIKPKKKLIVIVAFITGLLLSIFAVFFLKFIRQEDDK